MDYNLFAFLFVLGICLLGVGFVYNAIAGGGSNLSVNTTTSFSLLVLFTCLVMSFQSFDEMLPIFESFCGGVPYAEKIADFGSMLNLFQQSPAQAIMSFFDLMILSVLVDILNKFIDAVTGISEKKNKFSWMSIFNGILSALLALFILNFTIKDLPFYKAVFALLGTTLSVLSIGTLITISLTFFAKAHISQNACFRFLSAFSKTPIGKSLCTAFLHALIYVLGVFALENFFPELRQCATNFVAVIVAFLPVVVLLFCLGQIVKTVLK